MPVSERKGICVTQQLSHMAARVCVRVHLHVADSETEKEDDNIRSQKSVYVHAHTCRACMCVGRPSGRNVCHDNTVRVAPAINLPASSSSPSPSSSSQDTSGAGGRG